MNRSRTHRGLVALFVGLGVACVALIGYRWAGQTRRTRPVEPFAPPQAETSLQPTPRGVVECSNTSVYAVGLAADGKRLFVAGADPDRLQRDQPVVRVWDVDAGREMAPLRRDGEVGRHVSLAPSPDGKSVAAGGLTVTGGQTSGNVCVWDLEAGAVRWSATMARPVECVAWSADGSLLAAGDRGGAVAVWDAAGADAKASPPPGEPNAVSALAWGHAGKRLAIGNTRSARVWDAAERRDVAVIAPPNNRFTALAFAPDDRSVFVAGRVAGDVWVWDLESNSESRKLTPQPSFVAGLVLGPGARSYFTLVPGRPADPRQALTIRCWDLATGGQRWYASAATDDHALGQGRFAVTPDGKLVAFAVMRRDEDGPVWSVELHDPPPPP